MTASLKMSLRSPATMCPASVMSANFACGTSSRKTRAPSSLSTSLAIWPYALAIIAWIVVFAVGGIVGYAQEATTDMRENVQESVDEGVEDAKDDARKSVEEQVERGVEDARQNATENLEDALPGGNG